MKVKKETMIEVGYFCRDFRLNIIQKTLEEVANGTNLKTLSGFEHGRSSNLLHIFKYLESCDTREERILYMKQLSELMEGLNVRQNTR